MCEYLPLSSKDEQPQILGSSVKRSLSGEVGNNFGMTEKTCYIRTIYVKFYGYFTTCPGEAGFIKWMKMKKEMEVDST